MRHRPWSLLLVRERDDKNPTTQINRTKQLEPFLWFWYMRFSVPCLKNLVSGLTEIKVVLLGLPISLNLKGAGWSTDFVGAVDLKEIIVCLFFICCFNDQNLCFSPVLCESYLVMRPKKSHCPALKLFLSLDEKGMKISAKLSNRTSFSLIAEAFFGGSEILPQALLPGLVPLLNKNSRDQQSSCCFLSFSLWERKTGSRALMCNPCKSIDDDALYVRSCESQPAPAPLKCSSDQDESSEGEESFKGHQALIAGNRASWYPIWRKGEHPRFL